MTLDQDWGRLIKTIKKCKEQSPFPNAKIFYGIKELRKADNKGIDFVIRRLKASKEYGDRIRAYGAPTGHFPRYPLRIKTYGSAGFMEYHFDSISVKNENGKLM